MFVRFSADISLNDSDFETEPELPALPNFISKDILRKLKPEEKKWQEVVNGKHYVIVIRTLSSFLLLVQKLQMFYMEA